MNAESIDNPKSLRIGAVPYTNALPLVEYLPRVFPAENIERVVPSRLGRHLAEGAIDVALLSSIELLRNPQYLYLPGLGICSDGPVRSVCLFCREDPSQVQTIALDRNSLTSIVLLKILLHERWNNQPELVYYSPPVENGLAIADAALSIGDASFDSSVSQDAYIDLGEEWKNHTGLPFVFALWIAQPTVDAAAINQPFIEALEIGMAHVETIAARCAQEFHQPMEMFTEYFTKNIQYSLGENELKGMELFFEKAKNFI